MQKGECRRGTFLLISTQCRRGTFLLISTRRASELIPGLRRGLHHVAVLGLQKSRGSADFLHQLPPPPHPLPAINRQAHIVHLEIFHPYLADDFAHSLPGSRKGEAERGTFLLI